MIIARLMGTSGTVYAFEPDQTTFQLLKRNIARNGLSEHIQPIQQAVYAADGTIEFHTFDRKFNRWNSIGRFAQEGIAPQTVQQVPTITLDTFCRDHQIQRIDLMKIDVEGAEPDVFAGAKNTLQSGIIERIIFEISRIPMTGMGYTIDDSLKPLTAAGYTIYQIYDDGHVQAITPEAMHNIAFANYLAMRQ